MDIFAHALWANAGARKVNEVLEKKNKPTTNWAWTSFWGIFPDLFAFGLPIFFQIYYVVSGNIPLSHFLQRPPAIAEEPALQSGFSLAPHLYPYSHSIIIFSVVFGIVWLIYRRPHWELLGWALHIFIDIFSHSANFYPTPFLFPVSNYHYIYGIAWSNIWFMITNYIALLGVYGYAFWKKKSLFSR